MAGLGLFAIMTVVIMRPTSDNTALIAAVASLVVPTTVSLLAFMKSQETYHVVNSRIDEFKMRLEEASVHERELSRAAGVAEGRALTSTEASLLSDSIITRMDKAVSARLNPPLSVLHVDDNQTDVKLVWLILSGDNMQVRAVANQQDILKALMAVRPDVILLDLELGHDSGPRLAAWLQQEPRWREIPIVLCSGHIFTATEVLAMGAVGAIWKPFNALTFAAAVRQYATVDLTQQKTGA